MSEIEPPPVAEVTVTQTSLAKAFEQWNNGVRTAPCDFRSIDECNAMGVSQLSMEQAVYFMSLLQLPKA